MHRRIVAEIPAAPNAGIVRTGRRRLLKAIHAIAPGDEVTHDYLDENAEQVGRKSKAPSVE